MYTDLKPILKSAMKMKGVTYKELGKRIGMTESGVKKLFHANDCSLSRLEKIAQVLEIDLGSLILQAQDKVSKSEEIDISLKVQTILQKNPLFRNIFWLLLVEDLSPSDILERYAISKGNLYKGLAELDRMGCIRWNQKDRVVTAKNRPFVVKSEGPLIQQWLEQFSDSLIRDIAADKEANSGPNNYVAQRFLYLTKESVIELRKRLEEVILEFNAISIREKKLGKSRIKGIRLQTAFSVGSMLNNLSDE